MKEILFVCQKHEADRAGLHYDYRIVHGEKAYSWASKKELPKTGEMRVWFEQPIHDSRYALSKKIVIPKGNYGAGVTELVYVKKALVHEDSTESKIKFTTSDSESFLLKKIGNDKYGAKGWLVKNISNSKNLEQNKYLRKALND